MSEKYLFIDTNNFIEPFESGFKQTQINKNDFIALKKLLDKKNVNIFLPECIYLEVSKLATEKKQELINSLRDLNKKTQSDSKRIQKKINIFYKKLIQEETKRLQDLDILLKAIINDSVFINIDEEIYLNSYRRVLLGKKPFNKKKQLTQDNRVVHSVSPDVIAIESIKYILKQRKIKDYKLVICSHDPDYCEENGKELDPQIKNDFVDAKLYSSLRECLRTEYAINLPEATSAKLSDQEMSEELSTSKPPVPIETLIEELEKSGSFDDARKNMSNLLNMKNYLTTIHLKKILKVMFSNPYNYSINQVMAVDVGEEFTKKLYQYFKDQKLIWLEFADDLKLFYGKKYQYLEDYDWLFERLGVDYRDKENDIPF